MTMPPASEAPPDPLAARRHRLLVRYARRARMLSLAERGIIGLLALNVIALVGFGLFGVLPEAQAKLADPGATDIWQLFRSVLNNEALIVFGALVTSGRWLHTRLQHSMKARTEAKIMCVLIKRNDPRIQARLRTA